MPATTAEKRIAFRKLHETGCFVLPNPWDVGSARALQHMGFKAIASTSARRPTMARWLGIRLIMSGL